MRRRRKGKAEGMLVVCEGETELQYLLELAAFMSIGEKVDIRRTEQQDPGIELEVLAKAEAWAEICGLAFAAQTAMQKSGWSSIETAMPDTAKLFGRPPHFLNSAQPSQGPASSIGFCSIFRNSAALFPKTAKRF